MSRSAHHARRSRAAPVERRPAWTSGDTPSLPTLMATWPAPQIAQSPKRSRAAAGSSADRRDTRGPGTSDLGRAEPDPRADRRGPGGELVEEAGGRRLGDEEAGILRADEPLADRAAEEPEEIVPVPGHVDQADRLPVDTELGPGERL